MTHPPQWKTIKNVLCDEISEEHEVAQWSTASIWSLAASAASIQYVGCAEKHWRRTSDILRGKMWYKCEFGLQMDCKARLRKGSPALLLIRTSRDDAPQPETPTRSVRRGLKHQRHTTVSFSRSTDRQTDREKGRKGEREREYSDTCLLLSQWAWSHSQSRVTESAHTKLSTHNVFGREIRNSQKSCTVPVCVPSVDREREKKRERREKSGPAFIFSTQKQSSQASQAEPSRAKQSQEEPRRDRKREPKTAKNSQEEPRRAQSKCENVKCKM